MISLAFWIAVWLLVLPYLACFALLLFDGVRKRLDAMLVVACDQLKIIGQESQAVAASSRRPNPNIGCQGRNATPSP